MKWIVIIILILAQVVAAQITTSPGSTHFEIQFHSDSATNYTWDFNNDNITDSTDQEPIYTFTSGTHQITLITNNETFTTTITIAQPLNLAATATPENGIAPLKVQFTAITTEPNTLYSWDFNNDQIVDSTTQNPTFTFENAGEYNITLKATSKDIIQTKIIPIHITDFDSKITLISSFPTTVKTGENQLTFIISNTGTETVRNIEAKVIGTGIQHTSSTIISTLKSSDQDSITSRINILQTSGSISAIVKILDKTFPLNLTISEQVQYNKTAITANLEELKNNLNEQEKIYYEKKAQGYLVTEIFDSIKTTKNKLQETEQYILTGKLSEAEVNVNLFKESITDIRENLQNATKQEQTFLMWIKDNAVAIAAVIAALGTISGFVIKASTSVKTHATKLGETVKNKISKEKTTAQNDTSNQKEPEKKE